MRREIEIYRAEYNDWPLLLAWLRLLPSNASRGNTNPTWAEHFSWCRENPGQYIIWYNDRKVGVVGYVLKEGEPWVSIHIAEPELRGKGIATEAIKSLMWVVLKGYERCWAEVHQDNYASQRLFESLGFKIKIPMKPPFEWVQRVRELEP